VAVSADDHPSSLREKAAIIHQIRTLMEYWSITPEELERAPHRSPSPASAADRPAEAVKYRHPKTGQTWNGDGAHPQWLRDALLKEGYTVDELRAAAAVNG
jgi:DNA-binding protein H-NS